MNSILKTDFYKCCHMLQYDDNISHLTSYLIPRGSRFKNINEMVIFGITNFVNEFLVHDFNENFFNLPKETISKEVREVLMYGLEYGRNDKNIDKTIDKVLALHSLGYLPIELNGLPEGTLCPMQVPAIEIRSTHKDCAWVVQVIESLLSCEIWHPCISATMALEYKKIAMKAYNETTLLLNDHSGAMCDFSMRGQESYKSAISSGAAFLTAFNNCSTVEARDYIKQNYIDGEIISVYGLTSTEHSVMCSDFSIYGDEKRTLKHLLVDVYPKTSFAAVCDSYDFWRVVTEILPTLKKEIMEHEGFLGVRHDSSEPVYALCGIENIELTYDFSNLESKDNICYEDYAQEYFNENGFKYFSEINCEPKKFYIKYIDINTREQVYSEVVLVTPEISNERGAYTDSKYYFIDDFSVEYLRDEMTWEEKGLVQTLYELFGGTVNSLGYKEINSHLKAVYGDSITIQRAKEIYRRLKDKGFAANNVSLGVGSFSMQCLEEDGQLKPFTRDSFSIAIKATYGKYFDASGKEQEIEIFKNPKGCKNKRSLRGLCRVVDVEGKPHVIQGLNEEAYNSFKKESLMINYFKNGKISKRFFSDIRRRMYNNALKGE